MAAEAEFHPAFLIVLLVVLLLCSAYCFTAHAIRFVEQREARKDLHNADRDAIIGMYREILLLNGLVLSLGLTCSVTLADVDSSERACCTGFRVYNLLTWLATVMLFRNLDAHMHAMDVPSEHGEERRVLSWLVHALCLCYAVLSFALRGQCNLDQNLTPRQHTCVYAYSGMIPAIIIATVAVMCLSIGYLTILYQLLASAPETKGASRPRPGSILRRARATRVFAIGTGLCACVVGQRATTLALVMQNARVTVVNVMSIGMLCLLIATIAANVTWGWKHLFDVRGMIRVCISGHAVSGHAVDTDFATRSMSIKLSMSATVRSNRAVVVRPTAASRFSPQSSILQSPRSKRSSPNKSLKTPATTKHVDAMAAVAPSVGTPSIGTTIDMAHLPVRMPNRRVRIAIEAKHDRFASEHKHDDEKVHSEGHAVVV